jgi:hypothetical protein
VVNFFPIAWFVDCIVVGKHFPNYSGYQVAAALAADRNHFCTSNYHWQGRVKSHGLVLAVLKVKRRAEGKNMQW